MAGFKNNEISEKIEQIRKMYATYSSQYKGNNTFDVELFNGRYLKALQERTDISTFIKAEVSVLEDLRARAEVWYAEKMKNQQVNEETFMSKVDAMLEKFSDAISKYPSVSIHANSNDEIDRLYGGFIELNACYRSIRETLMELKDYVVETMLKDIDNKMNAFAVSNIVGTPPSIYSDYFKDLSQHKEASRSEQFVLKEAGFFLHSFVNKFEQTAPLIVNIPIEVTVAIPDDIRDIAPRVYKSLLGKNQKEVFIATKSYADAMINDFRLQHFRQNGN